MDIDKVRTDQEWIELGYPAEDFPEYTDSAQDLIKSIEIAEVVLRAAEIHGRAPSRSLIRGRLNFMVWEEVGGHYQQIDMVIQSLEDDDLIEYDPDTFGYVLTGEGAGALSDLKTLLNPGMTPEGPVVKEISDN